MTNTKTVTFIAGIINNQVEFVQNPHEGITPYEFATICEHDMTKLAKFNLTAYDYTNSLAWEIRKGITRMRRDAANRASLASLIAYNKHGSQAMVATRMRAVGLAADKVEAYTANCEPHAEIINDAGTDLELHPFQSYRPDVAEFDTVGFQDESDIEDETEDEFGLDSSREFNDWGSLSTDQPIRTSAKAKGAMADEVKLKPINCTRQEWVAEEMSKNLDTLTEEARFGAFATVRGLHNEVMTKHHAIQRALFTDYNGVYRVSEKPIGFFIKMMNKLTDNLARSIALDGRIEYLQFRNDSEPYNAFIQRIENNQCVSGMKAAKDDDQILELQIQQKELEIGLSKLSGFADAFRELAPYFKFDDAIPCYQKWMMHDPMEFIVKRLAEVYTDATPNELHAMADKSFRNIVIEPKLEILRGAGYETGLQVVKARSFHAKFNIETITIGEADDYEAKKALAESLGYTMAPRTTEAEPTRTLYCIRYYGLDADERLAVAQTMNNLSYQMSRHYKAVTAFQRVSASKERFKDTPTTELDSELESLIDDLLFGK